MKTLAVVIAFASIIFAPGVHAAVKAPLTPEQIAKREASREKFLTVTGGIVFDKTKAVGHVAIINAQKRIDQLAVSNQVNRIEGALQMAVKFVNMKDAVDLSTAEKAIAEGKGKATVVVADMPGLPVIVSLPEKRCAFVNVAALAADGVNAEKLLERSRKEIARGVCYAFGIGHSAAAGSLMEPVSTLAGLDRILVDNILVEQKMHIERAAMVLGMKPYRRSTYAKACQEGWAPKPVDKYQEAIWKQVHEMPTKPLTIEPEK